MIVCVYSSKRKVLLSFAPLPFFLLPLSGFPIFSRFPSSPSNAWSVLIWSSDLQVIHFIYTRVSKKHFCRLYEIPKQLLRLVPSLGKWKIVDPCLVLNAVISTDFLLLYISSIYITRCLTLNFRLASRRILPMDYADFLPPASKPLDPQWRSPVL